MEASLRYHIVSYLLPSTPIVERAVVFGGYVCICFTVCGRVFVHGRMSSDGNKLQKVFQDGLSKALCVIMMMSLPLMIALIDTEQMSGWWRGFHSYVGTC